MSRYDYEALDETVYRRQLASGMTVLVVPRRGFTKKLAYLATDFGAVHLDFLLEGRTYQVPPGIAHYLEHKLFDMPDGLDVSEAFAQLGAVTNAFTGYDMTAYYFSTTEHYEECLELLLRFVTTPYFTRELVDKERGIIAQELAMNRDDPSSVGFESLMAAMYRSHGISIPILGTQESLAEITPELLYACHRAFYSPGNLLLTVIGDVDPEETFALADRVLGREPRPVGQKLRPWQETLDLPPTELTKTMEVAMPTFHFAFKAKPLERGEAGARRELIGDLACEALFGESSRLYLGLYEQGLIDSSFSGAFETLDGCAMVLGGGDSNDPRAVGEAILKEAALLVEEGIAQEDFLRLKRSALGRRLRGLDSFDSTCFRLCAYHFSGFDYFRFPQLYQSITCQEVVDFLRDTILPQRYGSCIIQPIRR